MILYCELLILIAHFSVTTPAIVDYSNQGKQNSIPTIIKDNWFSKILYINNSHPIKENRTITVKTSDLFLVNFLTLKQANDCYIIIKNQSRVNSAVPDYLLSSDLKSPPQSFKKNNFSL